MAKVIVCSLVCFFNSLQLCQSYFLLTAGIEGAQFNLFSEDSFSKQIILLFTICDSWKPNEDPMQQKESILFGCSS